MLFDSTTILLRSIVTSVENGGGEIRWEDHLDFGNQCLYELHQMSHSPSRPSRADSNAKFQIGTPPFARATRAIPHVKLMMGAIRRKDQLAAVEGGRAALAEMNGTIAAVHSASPIEPKPVSTQPATRPEEPSMSKVHRHKEPVKQKRAVVAKRKPVRVSAAGSR
jgi:hypothetical protein